MIFCSSIVAQNSPIKIQNGQVSAIAPLYNVSGSEVLSNLITNTNPNTIATKTMSMDEVLIGTTTYDLQSNASVDNRLIRHNDGTISATWTMSSQFSASYTDRGTGYNYHDGSSWAPDPSARLESSRGGWPSILTTGSGKEIAITHNTDNQYINNTTSSTIGSGTWIENQVSNGYMIWNRSAAGGLDGNTIHMIAVTAAASGKFSQSFKASKST